MLFVLLTGALPFAADNMDLMFDKIKKGDYRLPPELPNPAQDLIKSLINPTASVCKRIRKPNIMPSVAVPGIARCREAFIDRNNNWC